MTTTDTTPAQVATDDPAGPELLMLDPASLLVDLNIRQASLDKDFLASIKDHGVIEPVVAVRTADGAIRVRHGHRRTLAAIDTARATVPVYVVGAEDDDQADRIAKQWHENTHRAALTHAEQVDTVDQLALLGLSAATIARRLRTPRKQVDAAITVNGSELAKAATARYGFLTLEQSASIADYDGDTDAVTALVAAAKLGEVKFARTLAAATEKRAEAAARAVIVADLTERGIAVVEQRGRADSLDELADSAGEILTEQTHRRPRPTPEPA